MNITNKKTIKSFVIRSSYFSSSQKKALDDLFPIYGIEYQNNKIDLEKEFNRNSIKIIEIGFGMGNATIELALNSPKADILAIDVHTPGVGNLLKLINNHDIKNIKIIKHDVVEVIENMIYQDSIDGINIFFPDPWPKKRHHKRRLINNTFIDSLNRALKKGGYVHLATDWEDYALQMLELFNQNKSFKNKYDGFAQREDRPFTKFELKGIEVGRRIWDLIFIKI